MEDTLRDIKKEVIMLYPLAVCRRVKLLNENFYEIYDHKSIFEANRYVLSKYKLL